jgi:hypothetical protein
MGGADGLIHWTEEDAEDTHHFIESQFHVFGHYIKGPNWMAAAKSFVPKSTMAFANPPKPSNELVERRGVGGMMAATGVLDDANANDS